MRRLIFAFFVMLLLPSPALSQTSPDEAAQFISSLSENAVSILRDQSISLDQREQQLRDIVAKSFNVRVIGKYVLGDAWKQTNEDERAEYLNLFSSYVLQTYTQRLGGYSGQTLRVDESKQHREKDALVSTTIVQEGSDSIAVGWLVRKTNDGMRILDVVIDGKSLALAQKKEFQTIVARDKVAGLLQLLRLKVSKFSAQS